jgi:metallo-beta-lactamase class B
MKKISILGIGLIMVTTNLFAQFETKINDDLFISRICDTAYVVTHYFPWESNSLIVKCSPKEVMLIDTPCNTTATALMLDWINKTLKPAKITAINTGYHIDNLGGNQCLRDSGITIYGSDLTCKLIDDKGKQMQQKFISWLKPEQEQIKKVYETMILVKPNKLFAIQKGIVLQIGNLTFEVYYPGETHAPDNSVVYIKELHLLFAGCMLKALSYEKMGYTGDANITEWLKSIKEIKEKFGSARMVIPHHGMWGDSELLQHTIDLLEKKITN